MKVMNAADGGLDVRFNVKNVGTVPSDEVPQVYVSAPSEQPQGVQFAVRSLAAFARVHLDPGQSKPVALHVPLRSLQYWSTAKDAWVTGRGTRTVSVGKSSRDLVLKTVVRK
jgi:beta-glucosidase